MSKRKHYTTGVTTKGKTKTFATNCAWVIATGRNLVSLRIPDGVECVECEGNQLTDLKLSSTVKFLSCDKELFDYDKNDMVKVDIHYDK